MGTTFLQPGHRRDYTPSGSAKTPGQVVVLRSGATGEIGVCEDAIADGATGPVQVSGVHRLPKVSGAIAKDALVYWKAAGDPVGGSAGTGAMTTATTSNTAAGIAVTAATTGAAYVDVLINGRPGAALSD
jgi:predicted RecA/RadA family phage recombinase